MAAPVEGLCAEASAVMQRVAPISDLTIVSADGDEFAVSKTMMGAASVVLANMFADLKEGKGTREGAASADDTLTLVDKSEDVVLMLKHAYAGSKYKVDADNIAGCLRVNAKYDMPRLLEACHEYLDKISLGVHNLPLHLESANRFQVPRFTTRCVEYAAGHLQSIISNRTLKKRPPTAWLERLPKGVLVEILQARSRILGGMATTVGKRKKSLTDDELVGLEVKRARMF